MNTHFNQLLWVFMLFAWGEALLIGNPVSPFSAALCYYSVIWARISPPGCASLCTLT